MILTNTKGILTEAQAGNGKSIVLFEKINRF